jgi:hypothetical protein
MASEETIERYKAQLSAAKKKVQELQEVVKALESEK